MVTQEERDHELIERMHRMQSLYGGQLVPGDIAVLGRSHAGGDYDGPAAIVNSTETRVTDWEDLGYVASDRLGEVEQATIVHVAGDGSDVDSATVHENLGHYLGQEGIDVADMVEVGSDGTVQHATVDSAGDERGLSGWRHVPDPQPLNVAGASASVRSQAVRRQAIARQAAQRANARTAPHRQPAWDTNRELHERVREHAPYERVRLGTELLSSSNTTAAWPSQADQRRMISALVNSDEATRDGITVTASKDPALRAELTETMRHAPPGERGALALAAGRAHTLANGPDATGRALLEEAERCERARGYVGQPAGGRAREPSGLLRPGTGHA